MQGYDGGCQAVCVPHCVLFCVFSNGTQRATTSDGQVQLVKRLDSKR